MKIADNINHGRLGLSELMEIPPPPFGLIAKARFITPEPISKIARRLKELSKDPDDEYAWYPFEKFVISDYPPLIESQIELYDQLIAILNTGSSEMQDYPFSILRLKKGSIHKIAEIGQHYEHARDNLPTLKAAIKKFETALQQELNGSRLWDTARYEIEKELPDELGSIITYETIKEIEEQADSLTKEV
ncbi:hypothetical protein K5D69_20480 [Pseudomonas cichorii]|uniref:hypothetical protein n=1 Tax=Pseudomonas cichorii TaxID=36746 RepID=UPI001C892D0F|nr:hypothetical protein [Pseudomonas cichorii]MBX8517060.1 hypothetical protein [Pseudomonas cichorii]